MTPPSPPTDPDAGRAGRRRWSSLALALLVLAPMAFNAIALWPEVARPVPSLNDDAVHFLMVQRGSEALASGASPFDNWEPELELGFPIFFYYQHVPHLAVVLLHRLLLKRVDLLTLFNLVRYLLLVGLPLTVYWSMRRMGFSAVAAAVSAACASLLSGNHRYGFEYESYIWRGFGMYTQLWATHLSFISLACLYRLVDRGTGYAAAIVSAALLAVSHLIYTYMMAITGVVLLLVGLSRSNAKARVARLAVAGVCAGAIGAYVALPFILEKAFLTASPYLQRWKYDSFGAREILLWLVNGDLLDYGRLPVITVLLALGIASACLGRGRLERFTLILFAVWLALYFGRPTWGRLVDLLPMHEGLLLHRFIGPVDVAAIFLVGLGGEWLWRQCAPLGERWRAPVVACAVLVLLIPAFRERREFYSFNTAWIERTRRAIAADGDAQTILATLRALPPGRTYAGLREGWGKDLRFEDVKFTDLLTFYQIPAASPPYSSWSLNADLVWHFDEKNPAHYNLLNVRYVVAPAGLAMPAFLRPLKQTRRYTLYRVDTGGYAAFVALAERKSPGSQSKLFFDIRDWFLSPAPAAGRFVRYDYPAASGAAAESAPSPG
ncbi:MAG TPA: hypothetical protein VEL75_16015, partial [Candidatus Methylomirabilis sp.]|nr:hypothetical protein [Candidatus Methylomirabilis sp.]